MGLVGEGPRDLVRGGDPLKLPGGVIPALVRFRYVILVLMVALTASSHIGHAGTDWHYFQFGAGQFGLDLYAQHPEIQIGPLALLVTLGLGSSPLLGKLLIAGLGLGSILFLERAALKHGRDEQTVKLAALLGGLATVEVWDRLVATGHLDDALALAWICVAVWFIVAKKPLGLGLAIGLAVASKPWAVMATPLLLVGGLPAIVTGIALVFATWGPFVIASPATLGAARYGITVADDSGLRVLGWEGARAPFWQRPVQFAVGILVGAVTVLKNAWPLALLAVIAARVALDAGTYNYYDAGLVLGGLCWDLIRSRFPVPFVSVALFLFTADPMFVVSSTESRGLLLLVLTAALVLLTLLRFPGRLRRTVLTSR